MLFILEIIFTVAAWRKGWRWRALLPLCLPVFVGLILGFSVGISGGSSADLQDLINDIQGFAIFLDLVCLSALITMSARAPKQTVQPDYQHQPDSTDLSDSGAKFV